MSNNNYEITYNDLINIKCLIHNYVLLGLHNDYKCFIISVCIYFRK